MNRLELTPNNEQDRVDDVFVEILPSDNPSNVLIMVQAESGRYEVEVTKEAFELIPEFTKLPDPIPDVDKSQLRGEDLRRRELQEEIYDKRVSLGRAPAEYYVMGMISSDTGRIEPEQKLEVAERVVDQALLMYEENLESNVKPVAD